MNILLNAIISNRQKRVHSEGKNTSLEEIISQYCAIKEQRRDPYSGNNTTTSVDQFNIQLKKLSREEQKILIDLCVERGLLPEQAGSVFRLFRGELISLL